MGSRQLTVIVSGDVKGALAGFAELDAGAGRTESSIAGKFGAIATQVGVGVGAAVAAAGVALFKLGETFDEQYDKIRIGTGATGKTLESLKDDFKQVVQDVPTDFDKAGDAITKITQKLGLEAGPQLQTIAEQFLEVSRITKTDLAANLDAGTDALNNWNIPAEQQSKTLDKIFRATQISGVGFADLSSQLADSGVVLRAAGLDFDQAIGLVAALGHAGVDTSDVLPALSKALAVAAKDGKPAAEVLQETFAAIRGAPDDTKAAGAALDVFGAKAGPKLAQLIREGKLSYEDFTNAIVGGKDTILGAGKDTQDFAEKWEMFKNKVLVRLEPIATAVFNGVGKAMDELPKVMEQLAPRFREGLRKVEEIIRPVVSILESLWSRFGDNIINFAKGAWNAVKDQVQGAFNFIKGIFDFFAAVLQGDWSGAWDGIKEVVSGAWQFIKGVIELAWDGIKLVIGIALDTVKGILSGAWDTVKEVASDAWDGLKDTVSGGIDGVVDFVTKAPGRLRDLAGDFLDAGAHLGRSILDGIGNAISGAVDWAAGAGTNIANAVISAFNSVVGKLNDIIPDISFLGVTIIPDNPIPRLPHLATGARNFAGGLALVGEEGPELVHLPRGADVFTASETRRMAGSGDRSVVVQVTVQGSLIHERQLEDVVASAVRRAQLRNAG